MLKTIIRRRNFYLKIATLILKKNISKKLATLFKKNVNKILNNK